MPCPSTGHGMLYPYTERRPRSDVQFVRTVAPCACPPSLAGCQFAPPGATGSVVPPAAAPTNANPALERRPIGVPTVDPFPCATTAIAAGAAILWAPWPMEGHDLQRTNRSPIVGPRVGRVLWSVEIDAPSFGQVVEAADGTLYVGTESGKLQAVRPGVGVAWSFQASPPVPTPALGPDGSVYLRGGDGTLYALRSDGGRRWTTDIGAEPKLLGPAPLVGPDSYSYLTSYHQGLAYLVQPGGFFQWAINTQARTLAGRLWGRTGWSTSEQLMGRCGRSIAKASSCGEPIWPDRSSPRPWSARAARSSSSSARAEWSSRWSRPAGASGGERRDAGRVARRRCGRRSLPMVASRSPGAPSRPAVPKRGARQSRPLGLRRPSSTRKGRHSSGPDGTCMPSARMA